MIGAYKLQGVITEVFFFGFESKQLARQVQQERAQVEVQ